ncbi:MAG TPA: hypothetical protein VLJ42_00535 [Solirubrobacteraceae bacterium]|nr:hypothetical protein [Solirubrobacteraceae bacterium]
MLGDFACGGGACSLAGVSVGWLGEQLGAAFDRLLLRAHSERGHSPTFQREDSPVADHLPRHGERLIGRHLSRCLLQCDGVQVACVEHGVLLRQTRLDSVLDRPINIRPLGRADQAHGLVGAEAVTPARLAPHTLQVGACGQLLRPAVLEREVAQLPAFRCSAVAGTKPLGRPGDLTRAARELLDQCSWHAGDLEVAAGLAGAPLDLIALAGQLIGERGAVERAQLAG